MVTAAPLPASTPLPAKLEPWNVQLLISTTALPAVVLTFT